jgi:hypothetical protein
MLSTSLIFYKAVGNELIYISGLGGYPVRRIIGFENIEIQRRHEGGSFKLKAVSYLVYNSRKKSQMV